VYRTPNLVAVGCVFLVEPLRERHAYAVAEQAKVSHSTAYAMLNRLVTRGWMTRRVALSGQIRVFYRLTEVGQVGLGRMVS
jgi:DNA-binding PadR family transcriptional regulator